MLDLYCVDSSGEPISTLTQWDSNQKIIIQKSNFVRPPIFHFCNKKTENAIGVQSSISGENIVVDIPNSLLIEPYPITVYIYSTKDEGENVLSGKTVHILTIPIRKRVKPSTFLFKEDTNVIYLEEVIKSVDEYRKTVTDAHRFYQTLLVDLDNRKSLIDTQKSNVENMIRTVETKSVQIEEAITVANDINTKMKNSIKTLEDNVNRYRVGNTNNLIRGTKDFSGSWFDNNNGNYVKELIKTSIQYDGFTILKHNTDWRIVSQQFNVKAGDIYTFSFLAKTEAPIGKVGVRMAVGVSDVPQMKVNGSSLATNGSNIVIPATNEFKRYSITVEIVTNGILTPTIEVAYNTASDKTTYFGAFKLEKGNVDTGWSPHQQDVFDNMDNYKTLLTKRVESQISDNKSDIDILKHSYIGSNLLKGSQDFSGNWNIIESSLEYLKRTSTKHNGVNIFKHGNPTYKIGQKYTLKDNQWYTFSFYGKITDANGNIGIYFRDIPSQDMASIDIKDKENLKSVEGIRCVWNDATNQLKRFSVSFYCKKAGFILPYVDIGLASGGHGKEIWFGGFKLEKGKIATEWCPHSEDSFDKIEAINENLGFCVNRLQVPDKRSVDGWEIVQLNGVKMATKNIKTTASSSEKIGEMSVFSSSINLPTGIFSVEPNVFCSVDQQSLYGYIVGSNVTWITKTSFSVHWFKTNGASNGEVDIKLFAIGL